MVSMNWRLFALVVYGVQFNEVICGQNDMCRKLEFSNPIHGQALKRHVFKNISLDVRETCQLNCYLEGDCFSYNLGPLVNNRYVCELSNSDHRAHPGDLKPANGFLYGATKWNPCSTSPCSPNAKCQSGFTDEGHHCRCNNGYTGQACDQVVWSKINTTPVCFGTRDESYSSFTMKEAGNIGALKLSHISGQLVCNPMSTRSFWGCERPSYHDKTLTTFISQANSRTVLLPRRSFTEMGHRKTCGTEFTYRLDGFNDISPELVFNTSSNPLTVSLHQVFWIWYGQDLANCSEANNGGQSCVDVYGWYML